MLYLSCPTCGYCLGSKVLEYKESKKKICDNPKYDQEKKEVEITKLIKNLNLRRYCCRIRIMTYKEQVEEIQPIPKDD